MAHHHDHEDDTYFVDQLCMVGLSGAFGVICLCLYFWGAPQGQQSMLDLLLAIVRRTRAGRSAFSPDKMHLHHRLLQIGHSHRRVVLIIYLWVGIVAFGAASTIFFDPRYTGAVMLAAILVAVIITLIPLLRRREDVPSEHSD